MEGIVCQKMNSQCELVVLEDIRDGKVVANLPLIIPETNEAAVNAYTSHTNGKRNNYRY